MQTHSRGLMGVSCHLSAHLDDMVGLPLQKNVYNIRGVGYTEHIPLLIYVGSKNLGGASSVQDYAFVIMDQCGCKLGYPLLLFLVPFKPVSQ